MTVPSVAGARPSADPWDVAASVVDPEMPMLTLADLGVLLDVRDARPQQGQQGQEVREVVVTVRPTYSGCPALATMRDDLVRTLAAEGYAARVEVVLSPPWSSDDITPGGRAALRAHGLSVPGPAARRDGPVALSLTPTRRAVGCPRCGSADVVLTSEFGPTACTALYRCEACLEPFEHVKEH